MAASVGIIAGASVVGYSGAEPAPLVWNIGTVRPASVGGAWSVIAGSAHQPQGIGTPTCDPVSGNLTVPYTVTLGKVTGATVNTDEDWSRQGIIAGASVGLSYAVVLFTQLGPTGPQPVSCAALSPAGNLWVQVEGTP